MHLFLDHDFKRLNALIGQQNNLEGLKPIRNQISPFDSGQTPTDSDIWLVQIPQEAGKDRTYFENIFKQTPLRLDSYVFGYLQDDEATNSFVIYDIYKIDEYSETVQIVEHGQWNLLQGLIIFEQNIWKRRSNMKGHKLR